MHLALQALCRSIVKTKNKNVWINILVLWFFGLIHMYHAWLGRGVRKSCVTVLGFKFHLFATCVLLLSIWFYTFVDHGLIDFVDKPFKGDWNVHVLWRGLPFLPSFGLFSTNIQQIQRKDVPHGLTTLKTRMNWMNTNFCSLLSEKKILAPEKHCTHIVSVMWPN